MECHVREGDPDPPPLLLKAKINGRVIDMMVDSGASANFISTALATELGLVPLVGGTRSNEIVLADGRRVQSNESYARIVNVAFGQFRADLHFHTFPVADYEAVLGREFLV